MGLALLIKMAQSVHVRIIALVTATALLLPPLPLSAAARNAALPAGALVLAQFTNPADSLPALGEAETADLSANEERRLGDAIFQELIRAGVVFDDPEAQDYLTVQSGRLLGAAQAQGHLAASTMTPSAFRFFLVNDPSINAFALPGGSIGVHTGLIVQAASESELMSVMAHEIGHVTQRHIARMFGQARQSSAVMIAATILAALAAGQSGDLASGVLSLGQTMAVRDQLAFSRDAEREADRVGLSILMGAGFDGQGMTSLFERLAQSARFADQNSALTWLRTHPLTNERINDVSLRLGQLSSAQLRPRGPDSLEFGWIQVRLDVQARRTPERLRQGRGLLEQRLAAASSPAERSRLAYGLGWLELADRQFEAAAMWQSRAQAWAQEAGVFSVVEPMLIRLGQAQARAMGQPARAVALAREGLDRFPRSLTSRALARAAIEAALESGSAEDLQWAQGQARALTRTWPDDRLAWQQRSRLSARLGQRAAAHAAAAEAYALAGAWQAALEQFELARRAGDGDFVLLSQVDARMAKIRAELARRSLESVR